MKHESTQLQGKVAGVVFIAQQRLEQCFSQDTDPLGRMRMISLQLAHDH